MFSPKKNPVGNKKANRSLTIGILGSKERNWYPSSRLIRLILYPISHFFQAVTDLQIRDREPVGIIQIAAVDGGQAAKAWSYRTMPRGQHSRRLEQGERIASGHVERERQGSCAENESSGFHFLNGKLMSCPINILHFFRQSIPPRRVAFAHHYTLGTTRSGAFRDRTQGSCFSFNRATACRMSGHIFWCGREHQSKTGSANSGKGSRRETAPPALAKD